MKKPKYNILFLDMDGVVNSEEFFNKWKNDNDFKNIDYEKREELLKEFAKEYSIDKNGFGYIWPFLRDKVNKILTDVPNCKVVWTSSWRTHTKDSKLFVEALYNECGFKEGSFLSYTPMLSFQQRNWEIYKWLESFTKSTAFSINKCAIIDDDHRARLPEDKFENIECKFFQTFVEFGIMDSDVEEIINYFKGE